VITVHIVSNLWFHCSGATIRPIWLIPRTLKTRLCVI